MVFCDQCFKVYINSLYDRVHYVPIIVKPHLPRVGLQVVICEGIITSILPEAKGHLHGTIQYKFLKMHWQPAVVAQWIGENKFELSQKLKDFFNLKVNSGPTKIA